MFPWSVGDHGKTLKVNFIRRSHPGIQGRIVLYRRNSRRERPLTVCLRVPAGVQRCQEEAKSCRRIADAVGGYRFLVARILNPPRLRLVRLSIVRP